ncbi:MAG: hypothetical protein RQ952_01590 [Thermoproteota archaeon]|nr:hypothetical protein [Thermoproteota archaeon]
MNFLLTFIYQLSLQMVKDGTRRAFLSVYSIFLLSIIIPLIGAYYSNSRELALENITYILLSNTVIPPIIALISLFSRETGFRNPFKMILLFTIGTINCYVLKIAISLQLSSIGEIQINKLGIFELNLFLAYLAAFQSLFSGANIEPNQIELIKGIQDNSIYYILPIALFASYIYALKSIINNLELYDEKLYYKKETIEIEKNYIEILRKLALTSLVSVLISITLIYLAQSVVALLNNPYISFVLLVPVIMLIIIFYVSNKK